MTEHTIGSVVVGGVRYEIDWPPDPEDETRRNELSAFIYQGDDLITDVSAPFGEKITDAAQAIRLALEVIEEEVRSDD